MLTAVLSPDGPLDSKLGKRIASHSSLWLVGLLLQGHLALSFELLQLSFAEHPTSSVAKGE